jgi:predicted RNA-binding protein with PUA-like domain
MARCWLMKSEPNVYSIEDLERDGSTSWEGVRNYQARNLMREMEVGDSVLFYHSNAKPPGVAGLARIARSAYPDHFSWEPGHRYFDPKSTPDEPRWWMVDIEYVDTLPRLVSLDELKAEPGLEEMVVTRRSRLSVQPVKPEEYEIVVRMGRS